MFAPDYLPLAMKSLSRDATSRHVLYALSAVSTRPRPAYDAHLNAARCYRSADSGTYAQSPALTNRELPFVGSGIEGVVKSVVVADHKRSRLDTDFCGRSIPRSR
jgi:hypothetical protein